LIDSSSPQDLAVVARVSPNFGKCRRIQNRARHSKQQAGGSGSKPSENLKNMFLMLGIEEDEADDLIFKDEPDTPKEGLKWLVLAKVHTSNFLSPLTFEHHMRTTGSPAKEINFTPLENNLFIIQWFCLGDWLKVEHGGPWLFCQNDVIIEPYYGLPPVDSIELHSIVVWIHLLVRSVSLEKVKDNFTKSSMKNSLSFVELVATLGIPTLNVAQVSMTRTNSNGVIG
jgi:hypothetical protein